MSKTKMTKVYVVSGSTESGDNYIFVWKRMPTTDEILKAIKRRMPDEFKENNGSYDTHNAPKRALEIEVED